MSLISKEYINKAVKEIKEFNIEEESDNFIEIYDNEENRFLKYRYLEDLNVMDLFQFNSLKLDRDKFEKIVNKCIDKNVFMIVEKVVFINSEEELDELLEEYPCQSLNLENTLGINFYEDSVIVINMYGIKKCIDKELEEYPVLNYRQELSSCFWQTLVHELRHNITDNPIIPEEMIPISEGAEDKIEDYCVKVYDELISFKEEQYCLD